jgi:hypothetical protein
VDQVHRIGDGVEDHPGTAEDAGPLAYGTCGAGFLTFQGKIVLPLFENLLLPGV